MTECLTTVVPLTNGWTENTYTATVMSSMRLVHMKNMRAHTTASLSFMETSGLIMIHTMDGGDMTHFLNLIMRTQISWKNI